MGKEYIKRTDFDKHLLLSRLFQLHDVPAGVHIEGALPAIQEDGWGRLLPRVLTVVGSRKCTSYGKRVVEELLSSFTKEEVIVVSGLALGIDSAAHKVALKNNLLTIAIPGSGLDERVLYPSSNRELAREIVNNNGTLLSLFEDTMKAAQWTFPARNRIMAALSDAVLVVEAEEKSGTLITARQALELGKDIGAVPGEIFSQNSIGTLSLIRDGATPITSPNDLRELLHLPLIEEKKARLLDISEDELKVISLLRNPCDKDTLFDMSEMDITTFMSVFSSLELKGYIIEEFGEVRKIV